MERGINKLACRYSIVRFLPYQETGEFANVGIVLMCPETGYFDFKLQTRRYGRITDFFSELDSKVYQESVKLFKLELERLKAYAHEQCIDIEQRRKLFSALTHPRQAIIKLTEARPRLSDSPERMLEQLFRYYVEREFSTHEYRDTVVAKKVKALVDSLNLDRPFKAVTLGDEFVSGHFPLVQFADGQTVGKVIKPFALNHTEPSKIIQHGASWIDRVKRLRKKGFVSQNVLFAVEGPTNDADKCQIAFRDICQELREEVAVVDSSSKEKIMEFAAA